MTLVMNLDTATCKEAVRTRDARFDGMFFSAVKTTGIYCRTICPAKPLLKNIKFYKTAIEAESEGYRPCLRCRPEAAPGSAAWIGTSAVVRRALDKIRVDFPKVYSDSKFASQFGVSSRHLRRLFQDEMGVTPKYLVDMERLNYSRQLLAETDFSIPEVLEMSGFSSARRFNDIFKERFKSAPLQFRKIHRGLKKGIKKSIKLKVSFRPPYDWGTALDFFRIHTIEGVQCVRENGFERVFRIDKDICGVRVSKGEGAYLEVELFGDFSAHIPSILNTLRRIFDSDADIEQINKVLAKNKILKRLTKKRPGLRIIGHWDFFESCICTVLGQLVSIKQANRLIANLVKYYGEPIKSPIDGTQVYLFPTPKSLMTGTFDELGTTGKRKETVKGLSRTFLETNMLIKKQDGTVDIRTILLGVKGVGSWTAEYICLRGLGDSNAFPGTDLILKRALEAYPSLKTSDYSPWRGYAAIQLWHEYAKKLTKKKEKKK